MLGRGIVADPGLALALRGHAAPGWPQLLPMLQRYWKLVAGHVSPRHRPGRLKQWLNLLRRRFPEAQVAFDRVRPVDDPALAALLLFGAGR
jgi:tRNA-dihydrouridine synthase C